MHTHTHTHSPVFTWGNCEPEWGGRTRKIKSLSVSTLLQLLVFRQESCYTFGHILKASQAFGATRHTSRCWTKNTYRLAVCKWKFLKRGTVGALINHSCHFHGISSYRLSISASIPTPQAQLLVSSHITSEQGKWNCLVMLRANRLI